MQVLMQRKELQLSSTSRKAQSHAKDKLCSSEHLESADLSRRTSYPRIEGSASDASFVIKLLVSRLQDCGKSAKSCKILLRGCLFPSVQGADDEDAPGLEASAAENSCYQLSKFRRRTHVAVSKLAMLEDVASNIGGIMNMIGDEDAASDSDALERESTSTSSTLASI
eukprot:TRINITY_DN3837_c12_g1_i1.p1 TRINITY_DN3837_c12_g1~~TRINITY_DN3837_c12_g1_i1.p1  ORF type:complete len:196 (+),score=30.79 TRINITY_DN3837_c12_g1_i1:86-589(+)